MLKLGSITLDVPFFQASISGYSDYAMRKLARDFGAPLTFAGVMLAKSVIHPKIFNSPSFRAGEDEHPIGAQLLGEEPKVMAQAAKVVVAAGYDLIDLNFACPAPKVLRKQRGGFLLNEPNRIMEIYKAVKESVNCPVLMKLRVGFDESDACLEDFRDIVSLAAAAKVDALIIHPRTVCQRFTGFADWKFLAELKKKNPQLTIVGSGDLFNAGTVIQYLKDTDIDGAAIARGAIGNPWIFRQLRALYEGKSLPAVPSLAEQGAVVTEHFNLLCNLYDLRTAILIFRKFAVNYCKLHPKRKKVQKALFDAENREQFLTVIKQWYKI